MTTAQKTGLSIVVVVVLALIGTYYFVPGLRDWMTYNAAPQEVKDMAYLIGPDRAHVAFARVAGGMMHIVDYPGMQIGQIAGGGGKAYGLLTSADGKTDVYALADTATPVTTDGAAKIDLAVSSDGASIAFSDASGALTVLSVVDGARTSHGAGTRAMFLDDHTLLYVSGSQYVLEDLSKGTRSALADASAATLRLPPLAAGADTFIIKNPLIDEVDLYHVDYRNPLRLGAVGPVPQFGNTIYAFSANADAVYGFSVEDKARAVLWRYQDGATRRFFTFPDGVKIQDVTVTH